MGHTHVVTDTDARFVIDIASRKIKKATGDKPALMQYDHNSERYTFEMPRYIEGHDMSTCNQVGVHYLNIEQANKKEHSGLHEVEDLTIAGEDESKVVFSWLIKRGATQYHGKLNFLISFACVADGLIEYAWHTDFFTETAVNKGLDATGAFETEYVEIIERWKESVMAHFTGEIDKWKVGVSTEISTWKNETAKAVREEAFEDIATERKRIDLLSNYVTPQMFGAKGDGVTNDTEAIQACFDYAHENKLCVEFFKGTYIAYGLTLQAGVSVNGNGAILKKPNLAAEPYNKTVSEMKWIRLLTVSYSGNSDSEMTSIRNLEFDGNCWEMWSAEDGYTQEQASLLILSGSKSYKGKVNAVVENCIFRDSPSDGIHVVNNANVTINNCRSYDCFRGGLVITGGYTTVNVDGFEFNSDKVNDGIDIEVDSVGYGDSKEYIVNLSNIVIDKDMDIGVLSTGRVNIDNLVMRKGGYVIICSGELTIKNSLLLIDEENYTGNSSNMIYICRYANICFDKVVFDGQGSANAACRTIYYDHVQSVTVFDKCKFINGLWGINGSSVKTDATMIVMNSVFETTNGFGGNCDNTPMIVPVVKLSNNNFAVENEAIRCMATPGTPATVELVGNTVKSCAVGLYIHAPTLIVHDEVWSNGLAIKYSNGHSNAKYFGKRTNIVSSDPNGTCGIEGAHFEDYATDGTNTWKFKSGTVWDLVN